MDSPDTSSTETAETEAVRELFPETWLWTISDSGYYIMSRDGNLVLVSLGLGILVSFNYVGEVLSCIIKLYLLVDRPFEFSNFLFEM